MAATVELSTEMFDAASDTTLESPSINPAGSNRVLYVGVLSADAGTAADPTSVKWKGSGGTNLTKVSIGGSVGANGLESLWRLRGHATGSGTVYATWGAAQLIRAMIVVSVQDASQTTDTVHEATGTNNAPSDSVSSTSGDLVFDYAAFVRLVGGSPTLAATGGQTSIQEIEGTDLDAGGGGVAGLGSSSKTASGSSTTMSWTISTTPDNWRTILIAVPAAGGGGSSITGTGALTTAPATASGAGVEGKTATGNINSSKATVSSASVRGSVGSGSVSLPQIPFVTSNAGGSSTGSGALTIQHATSSGAGSHGLNDTPGAITLVTGTPAVIAGSGNIGAAQTGTGAITSSHATVSGTAARGHVGTGAITSSKATVAGTASLSLPKTASGNINTPTNQVSGVGVVGHFGTGAINSSKAIVNGLGLGAGGDVTFGFSHTYSRRPAHRSAHGRARSWRK